MNGYTYNQIRRMDEPFFVKVFCFVMVFLFPNIEKNVWDKHCEHMQKMLDNQSRRNEK